MSSSIAILSLLFLICVNAVHTQSCTNLDADVLILGGGMAGVTAANELQQQGISNFILLEAQKSLGGRMKKLELIPGVYVSEGASFIQGVDPKPENYKTHPLLLLANDKCQGLEGVYLVENAADTIKVYDATVDVTEHFLQTSQIYKQAHMNARRFDTKDRRSSSDISVRDGLLQSDWTPSTPLENFTEWEDFDFCIADTPDVSSLYGTIELNTYTDFLARGSPGTQRADYFITDQRGFVHLVNCLASTLSSDRVHLSTRVTKIDYNDSCVCVKATENGATRQYCAKYAILTFSMGVVKSEAFRSMVSPPFSQAKLNAMEIIYMTHYLKIYVIFKERFWDTDVFYIGRVDQKRGKFPIILTLRNFDMSQINATLLVVTGDFANQVIQQDEGTMNESIMQVFRSIYGQSVPSPISIKLETFFEDPLFLGCFSNIGLGFDDNTYRDLSSPEKRIYFAGEAYHEKYSGFVHGAYLSGMNTAKNIANTLTNDSGYKLSGSIVFLLLFSVFPLLL